MQIADYYYKTVAVVVVVDVADIDVQVVDYYYYYLLLVASPSVVEEEEEGVVRPLSSCQSYIYNIIKLLFLQRSRCRRDSTLHSTRYSYHKHRSSILFCNGHQLYPYMPYYRTL